MARPSDLETLSVKELRELRGRVDLAIVAREKIERSELRDKMRVLAEEASLSLEDVLGGKATRNGSGEGSVAPKYRNPDNPDQTWSGRGRQPLWLVEKLGKRGVTREDFAI